MTLKSSNLNKPHSSVITYILCYAQFFMKEELTGKWFLKKGFFEFNFSLILKVWKRKCRIADKNLHLSQPISNL